MVSIGVEMKYRLLKKLIVEHARERGLDVEWFEGANHTKVRVGALQTTIPRHSEINEITARSILRYLFGGR